MSNVFAFSPYDSRPAPFTITLGAPRVNNCVRCGRLLEEGTFCPCNSPEAVKAWHERMSPPKDEDIPTGCGCDDNDACGACATDETDPGALTSNVAVLIEVKACDDGAGYIAQCEQFSQYGMGDTPYEALRDYFAEMADFMDFLQRHEYVLGKTLTRELDYLRALAGNGRI